MNRQCPKCQGSIIRDGSNLISSNPASSERENMTVYVSSDRGKSWPVKRVVYPGPSAYSDLEITNDGNIICLHEAGLNHPYEGIAVTAIPKDKLLSL